MSPGSERAPEASVLRVEGLRKVFAAGHAEGRETQRALKAKSAIAAVEDVDFEVGPAETVGVVGESGSGKTTVARCVMRLTKPTKGTVYFEDAEVSKLHGQALQTFRQRAQMVFQDPFASIDQRFTALRAISEPLLVHRTCTRAERYDRARFLMRQVGLREELLNRYRHELSGGEAQRITIARALATNPRFLVLDEPTSALDASARLHVISLLEELRSSLGMTFLVISHDLNTIRYLCERVLVMYRGRIVEEGRSEVILKDPRHPYTRALISALPVLPGTVRRLRIRLGSAVESPIRSHGCPLYDRCPYAIADCAENTQELAEVMPGHRVACQRAVAGELDLASEEQLQVTTNQRGADT
jgi:oligopeptide/dipeptide ABC transporter ATP-binding protein